MWWGKKQVLQEAGGARDTSGERKREMKGEMRREGGREGGGMVCGVR